MSKTQYQERKVYCYDNLFFHPIVCHVCKCLNDGNTKLCDCGMISYCCQEHMLVDQEQSDNNRGHDEICRTIMHLIDQGLIRQFSGGTVHEWQNYKRQYVDYVKKKLCRELQPHEKQMLLYARSCYICYKETDLEPCKVCFSADYCNAHRSVKDDHQCQKLKEWLYFEIQAININPVPEWQTLHNFPNEFYDVHDMYSFYEAYILPARDASWTILDIAYSNYISWPLTMYYGLREAKLFNIPRTQNTFVIHIIEASDMDRTNLSSWEIILHIFQEPMKLIVIMIGLELAPEFDGNCGILQTCWEKCMPLGHQLYFSYYRMLYHDYADSPSFIKPDVILGFQVQLNNEEMLFAFIASLQLCCPIILTAESNIKIQKYINEIQKTTYHNITPSLNAENKFKSLRPCRNHVTGRIFYHNNYLLIYEHLNISQENLINNCIQA